MDVGFFLSDLLLQQGEVKAPGLGTFSLLRMSAYYDEGTRSFFPPYHTVSLGAYPDADDDTLAHLIANEKGISLESAKYFIEKYVSTLKAVATAAEVPVGNLGWFYTNLGQLTFKPKEKITNDPSFYGYAPVKLNKLEDIWTPQPEPELSPEPLLHDNSVETVAVADLPEATEKEEDIVQVHEPVDDDVLADIPEEETAASPFKGIWIALGLAVVLAVAVFVLYKYAPGIFTTKQVDKKSPPAAAPAKYKAVVVATPKPDSLHTDSLKKALNDSAAKVTSSVKTTHFELIAASFKTRTGGLKERDRLIKTGLVNARILEGTPGRRSIISVGSFQTLTEAQAQRKILVKQGKLTVKAYVQPIIEQKTIITSP